MGAMNEIVLTKQVILLLHPRTKKIMQEGSYNTSDLTIVEPVGYLNMFWLIGNSSWVMTDSGGLLKEAYYFSKPCITLRDETEWVELVESCVNILVGAYKPTTLTAFDHRQNRLPKGRVDLRLYGNG
jgi:UDP-GlcNAc3NAcA epimerase